MRKGPVKGKSPTYAMGVQVSSRKRRTLQYEKALLREKRDRKATHVKQESNHQRIFEVAAEYARRRKMFLLVETKPDKFGKILERWSILCAETGKQLGMYFPESRILRADFASDKCVDWRDAIETTARNRDELVR
jgi:hypothetical protein